MFDYFATVAAVAAVVLPLYVYFRVTAVPRRPRLYQPVGTPIDTTPIASKVAAVRQNPISALQTKAVRKSRRAMLIAAARGAIRGLPFFRAREHEHVG